MIKIFTDVISRQHFDSDGNLFGSSMPQMFFRSKETVAWQLCAESFDLAEDESPELSWEKYQGYADAQGLGAYLTADNNYTHKLQGTLKTEVAAGSVTEIEAVIPAATQALLDQQGVVTLFNPDGAFEQFEYDGRTLGENNLVTFTITGGSTADNTYITGVTLDVNEACFMQSSLDPVLSDPASGLFVFEVTAYSEKLRSAIVYDDVREVNIAGLELAIFTVDGQTSIVQDIGRYVLGSFSIQSGIADTSLNPVVGTQRANDTLAYINALLSGGFEVRFSQTADGVGDPWHETQTADDRYFRFRSALVGGDWSEPILVPAQPLLYRAYASDNAGSDFTLTASGSLEYFADIYVLDAFSSPPTLTDFNNAGAVWLRWKGSKGDAGTSQFTKIAYASDDQGAGFSLIPAENLKYRAEIVVDTDIAIPTITDFNNNSAVWVRYLGNDGADGTSQFTKVAWASDDQGADFSLVPSNTLKYRAEIVLHEDIAVPALIDFTNNNAVWVKCLGDDGEDGDDGESRFIKVGWASNNQGADFSLVPNRSLKYRAEVVIDTDIASPTLTDFDNAGAVWVQYIDDSHADLSNELPLPLGDTALAGTGLYAAREDHVHDYTGLVTEGRINALNGVAGLDGSGKLSTGVIPDGVGAEISSALPKPLGATALAGSGVDAAASDHVHSYSGLVLSSEKGVANGIPTLGNDGKVPLIQLPEGIGSGDGGGGAPLSDDTPLAGGIASAGVSEEASRSDHVHPDNWNVPTPDLWGWAWRYYYKHFDFFTETLPAYLQWSIEATTSGGWAGLLALNKGDTPNSDNGKSYQPALMLPYSITEGEFSGDIAERIVLAPEVAWTEKPENEWYFEEEWDSYSTNGTPIVAFLSRDEAMDLAFESLLNFTFPETFPLLYADGTEQDESEGKQSAPWYVWELLTLHTESWRTRFPTMRRLRKLYEASQYFTGTEAYIAEGERLTNKWVLCSYRFITFIDPTMNLPHFDAEDIHGQPVPDSDDIDSARPRIEFSSPTVGIIPPCWSFTGTFADYAQQGVPASVASYKNAHTYTWSGDAEQPCSNTEHYGVLYDYRSGQAATSISDHDVMAVRIACGELDIYSQLSLIVEERYRVLLLKGSWIDFIKGLVRGFAETMRIKRAVMQGSKLRILIPDDAKAIEVWAQYVDPVDMEEDYSEDALNNAVSVELEYHAGVYACDRLGSESDEHWIKYVDENGMPLLINKASNDNAKYALVDLSAVEPHNEQVFFRWQLNDNSLTGWQIGWLNTNPAMVGGGV